MKIAGNNLVLKWEVAYNMIICKHFDKGLNTMYTEP